MSNHIDYEINKELGECYLFMGEYDKAADYYGKAVANDSSQADPYMGLAAISLNRGALEEALLYYTMASSIERSDKPLTGMAMVEMELGQHATAFDHYVEALTLNPSNMLAVNGLVQLSYFLGRLEDAVPSLETALKEKDNETLRYTLSGCLIFLGREQDARDHLRYLLEKNPAHADAKELYAQVAA